MSEKSLHHVRTFQDLRTNIVAENQVRQYWTIIEADRTESFDLGVARFTPDARGTGHCPDGTPGDDRDVAVIVSEGEMAIEIGDGQLRRMNQYDIAYVPADRSHRVRNVGERDAWLIWATVPPGTGNSPEPTVSSTFAEIDAGTGVDPDDIKRYWIPFSQDHLGIEHFEMGIIFRPPGTEVPLHRHDPPETKEAFVVLDGEMVVEGREGRTYQLSDYEGLYVPPDGQHSNRNVGSETLRYVFIETPAEPDLVFL